MRNSKMCMRNSAEIQILKKKSNGNLEKEKLNK
jgi:hypothetical protein